MAMIEREAIIRAFADVDTDVMADYGPDYGSEWGFSREAVKKVIQNIPAIDPIHAAGGCYCRECKRCDGFQGHDPTSKEVGVCHIDMAMVSPNDFYSRGKLREAQDDE